MPIFVSLLRGINVGGNKLIKMDSLKDLYASIGLTHAQSHLQSGNVIFESKLVDRTKLTKKIEDAIEKTFDLHSDVILRTSAELREVVDHSPWSAKQLEEPGKLLVTFLSATPDAAAMKDFLKSHVGPEHISLKGQDLFIFFPTGVGQSKLNTIAVMKKLKISGTGRNWNTVRKLLELAEAMESK